MKVSHQASNPAGVLWFLLVAAVFVFFSSSCSTSGSPQDRLDSAGIAVIGVTAKSGLNIGFNRNLMAREFAELLGERKQFAVLPVETGRRFIGGQRLADMLGRYADTGELAQQDVQLLMASGLPVPRAVIARVEQDFIRRAQPRVEPVLNAAGDKLTDRERIVLATERTTRLSATMIDLRTGAMLWHREYSVSPATEQAIIQYRGSSFSGSLAAVLANTVVNGVRVPDHPAAPPLRLNLRALLREVTRNLPAR